MGGEDPAQLSAVRGVGGLRQTGAMGFTRRGSVRTPVLEIAYEEAGPADGPVAVLSHGFPYDVRAYDEVARRARGIRHARDRAVPARLRPHPVHGCRDDALG